MKKLLVGLLTALLMTLGLVSFTDSSANAACPYTGCIATRTKVGGNFGIKHTQHPRFTVRVTAQSGDATPRGIVKVTIKSSKGYYKQKSKQLSGGSASITFPKLKSGNYQVKGVYIKQPNSAFSNSGDSGNYLAVK